MKHGWNPSPRQGPPTTSGDSSTSKTLRRGVTKCYSSLRASIASEDGDVTDDEIQINDLQKWDVYKKLWDDLWVVSSLMN